MKSRFLSCFVVSGFILLIIFSSCKKSNSNNSNSGNGLSALSGSWQTTVWGGPNDTARITISTAGTGTFTYLNAGALTTKFAVNDVVYSNITASSTNTCNCKATYRYTGTSSFNSQVGTTTDTLTLQSGGTILYAHSAQDASTGITPPDYYWTKQ